MMYVAAKRPSTWYDIKNCITYKMGVLLCVDDLKQPRKIYKIYKNSLTPSRSQSFQLILERMM